MKKTLIRRIECLEKKRSAQVWAILSVSESGNFYVEHVPIVGADRQTGKQKESVFSLCEVLSSPGMSHSLIAGEIPAC
jgi:hypothetical protein